MTDDAVNVFDDAAFDEILRQCANCSYLPKSRTENIAASDRKYSRSSQIGAGRVRFRLEVDTVRGGSGAVITVVMRFARRVRSGGAMPTEADATAMRDAFRAAIPAHWNGKRTLRITDPLCGVFDLPITAQVLWTPDDTADAAHYNVLLLGGDGRSEVAGRTIRMFNGDVTDAGGYVLAHETGHCFGLPDEYRYRTRVAATVRYLKADGSNERLEIGADAAVSPGANIMSIHGDTTVLPRHFNMVEIEAQRMLRAETGRAGITCAVV